ncbi:MAG: hypothetical protein QXD77_01630, partial [Candidatus Aenigmatarchaeota archaeon]
MAARNAAAKALVLASCILLLLPCAALAVSVDIPSETVVLKDWLSPYGYIKTNQPANPNGRSFQTFTIDSNKAVAENKVTLPSHIYYRVLVAADGTTTLVDQFYFRGNESTSSVYEKLKPPSQGGYYSPDTVAHNYNKRTLPAKTIDVKPGTYRLEVRHIEIAAPTVLNYVKTKGDDLKLTKDTAVDMYSAQKLLIFVRDIYSSNYGSSYTDRVYYPDSVCNRPIWNEQATSYQNYPYGTITYHVEQYCYSLSLSKKAVTLSSLAKTEKVYSFTAEQPPLEPPIGINPHGPITPIGEAVVTDSPFGTNTGDQKATPAKSGAVATIALTGMAAVGASYALARPSSGGRPKLTVTKDELMDYSRNFAAELEASIGESLDRLKEGLKRTEAWANEQINKAKATEELEKRQRTAGERSGGIPLVKVGGSYFRKDIGGYWSTPSPVPVFGNGWSFSGGNVTERPPWKEPAVALASLPGRLLCGRTDGPRLEPQPHPTLASVPMATADQSETARPNAARIDVLSPTFSVLDMVGKMFEMVGDIKTLNKVKPMVPNILEGAYFGAVYALRGTANFLVGKGSAAFESSKALGRSVGSAAGVLGVVLDAPAAWNTGVQTGTRARDETDNRFLGAVAGAAATATYLVAKPVVDVGMAVAQGAIGTLIAVTRA